MRIGGRKYNVKAGLTAFLAISVTSALVVLYFGVDKNTWSGIKRISPEYGLLAGILIITHWCLNGLRFQILVNSFGEKVSFWNSFRAFMVNVFMSAITPSQTGGGPLQIYVLNRAGIPLAKAFSGCLMGAVLTVFCSVSSTLAILLLEPDLRLGFGHYMSAIFSVVIFTFLFWASLFLLSIFKIKMIKRFIGRSLLLIAKVIKAKRRLSITKKVMRGLDQYSKCMAIYAKTGKRRVVLASILTMASISAFSLTAPILLKGLNIHHNVLNVFLAQFILFFVTYFSPTPGGSGVAEFSNYLMMTFLNVERSMLGIYTLIWRFFTSFLGIGVGGLIVLSLFRRGKRKIAKHVET